ncbi:MAG TPA: SDR family oxidoreductase [Polyangiaceae bacterium]|nr:SDR family oxidoreductase [Polyangiaceae bacterium]
MASAVLITGFPNAASRVLVRRLLADEAFLDPLFLFVSPAAYEQARQFASDLAADVPSRVVLIEGNVSAIDLGLGRDDYRSLAKRVNIIHHTNSANSSDLDPDLAEEINVGGAREIIELSRAASDLSRLVFYSSAFVCGDRTGVILESELQAGQGFRSASERTLATAERMVWNSFERLAVTVVRPSLLACDSQTGEIDAHGPFAQLAPFLAELPQEWLGGASAVSVNLVPLDFLVKASIYLGHLPGAVGKVFHITDPKPPTVGQVADSFASSDRHPEQESALFRRVSQALRRAPAALSRAPRALIHMLGMDVHLDTTQAQLALAGSGIQCPSFGDYAPLLVKSVRHCATPAAEIEG